MLLGHLRRELLEGLAYGGVLPLNDSTGWKAIRVVEKHTAPVDDKVERFEGADTHVLGAFAEGILLRIFTN